ncbi:MAG: hypothetical protein RBT36_02780 [Desulfobulbus sp.]|jgi:hypothetical protein|nr:hypothetical protein [Desulfobulbus sp.]
MRITLMSLLVLLFAGCTLNPGYDQPPLDAPKDWRLIDHDARDVAGTDQQETGARTLYAITHP